MDETARFKMLREKMETLTAEKIRIEERYNAGKAKLEKLLKEITAAGYDYKKLSDIRSTKAEALKSALDDLEKRIQEAEAKLQTIES